MSGSSRYTALRLWRLASDGKPDEQWELVESIWEPRDATLVRTPRGMAAAYARADANAALTLRVFLQPVLTAPRTRAVRH